MAKALKISVPGYRNARKELTNLFGEGLANKRMGSQGAFDLMKGGVPAMQQSLTGGAGIAGNLLEKGFMEGGNYLLGLPGDPSQVGYTPQRADLSFLEEARMPKFNPRTRSADWSAFEAIADAQRKRLGTDPAATGGLSNLDMGFF